MPGNCDVIGIFLFMANLERSGRRIPEAWSTKLIPEAWSKKQFSLTVTFYLTKTENRTKKSLN